MFGPAQTPLGLIAGLLAIGAAQSWAADQPGEPGEVNRAVQRAVAFLSREVPAWRGANGCYSCHNNADAVRSLVAASHRKLPVAAEVLDDSRRWLQSPSEWRHNGGDGEFNDRELAAVQFAFALVAIRRADEAAKPACAPQTKALTEAAGLVAGFQRPGGAWGIGPDNAPGSPATYGPVLSTVVAREVLRSADDPAFEPAIARAEQWLREYEPRRVIDAAALLYRPFGGELVVTDSQRDQCLDVIRRGRQADGGWGPYVNSSSEPFDTALVLLALQELPASEERTLWIAEGRRHLRDQQLDDGSWLETTRPAGRESYAQRISTTAWCLLALLVDHQ